LKKALREIEENKLRTNSDSSDENKNRDHQYGNKSSEDYLELDSVQQGKLCRDQAWKNSNGKCFDVSK